ncbi:M48 family metallopeptidase [Rhizorhabdus argentea]|uniref:M48 family metallopeptidase n=1 Tax=Rhizorhabdus argentea TaxID=1387174 RepID=UPI0030EB1C49
MSEPSDPAAMRATAWLYDGQSASRHAVSVTLEGDRLAIDGFPAVALGLLRRLDGRLLCFGRSDIPGWRLGFDQDPPTDWLARLPGPLRYGRLIDRLGLWPAAIAGAALSALILLGAISGLDLLARAIPFAWEQRLGDSISGDFEAHACHAPEGQKALDGLARRLSPASRPIRVTVLDIPVVNAVALPGGRILIFDRLIAEARSPDELAGVLAHEIGHVEHRHVLVAMMRRFGIGLLVGSGGNTAQYGQALLDSRYSRAAEAEADDYSIEHLRSAGISPAATAALFARLGRDESADPGIFAYLASHPPSADRRRRFAAAARTLHHPSPALQPAAWQAVRAMCDKAKATPASKTFFRF